MIVSMTIHLLKDEMSDSHADLFSNASAYLEQEVNSIVEWVQPWYNKTKDWALVQNAAFAIDI